MSRHYDHETFKDIVQTNGYTLKRTRTELCIDAARQVLFVSVVGLAAAGLTVITDGIVRPEYSEGSLQMPVSTSHFSQTDIQPLMPSILEGK